MPLSNKGILPVLWDLYPNHELLLEAHFADNSSSATMSNYVRKPLMSREGANITLVRDGATIATTPGPYEGRQIIQALTPDAIFDHRHTVLGVWMIDQGCCGLGRSRVFQPHHRQPQLLRPPLLRLKGSSH